MHASCRPLCVREDLPESEWCGCLFLLSLILAIALTTLVGTELLVTSSVLKPWQSVLDPVRAIKFEAFVSCIAQDDSKYLWRP